MGKRAKVMVVGSFNTDLSMRTPRVPVKGETILGGPFSTGPGGKGANQAVAAARLGAEVSMVVKLGQDVFGDQAAANLEKEGVSQEYIIRTTESHTGAAIIVVDDSGENLIVVAGGANNLVSVEDVELARQAIARSDVLLVQLEVPLAAVERALRIAKEAGVRTILNPAPGQPLGSEVLALVDVLTPNETETQIITGMPVETVDQAGTAAEWLLRHGVGAVVVTLGGKGALVVTPQGAQHVPGRAVKVVDTTGAGDAFSGALAVALAEGKTLTEAAAFANAAAAIQVTRPGTAPAMAYRDEVAAFIK